MLTTEQLAALKEVAEKAVNIGVAKTSWEITAAVENFKSAFRPATCLALLEQVERLTTVVNAAVEWRRFGYERKHEFCVGISPLLDAIDVYDVGQRRPSTEYTGEDD
jgi:hypothetical protein